MKCEEEDEELSMTKDQLQRWVQEEVDKDELLVQRRTQLAQVEDWVKQKEREGTYTRLLYNNTCESVLECESVMKGLYGMLGLEYQDTDSEEEGGAKPAGDVIQIADGGDEDDDDDASADGDDYVVIDLGAALPETTLEEKPKVQLLSANVQMPSKSSSSQPFKKVMSSAKTSVPHTNPNDLFTTVCSLSETETSYSRNPEPSNSFLPTIKTRESPVPISGVPSPDLMPSTSFRPISPPVKKESSPFRSTELSNNVLPTIKTRESPVPISSPPPSDLPPTSFIPFIPKRENSPSTSPEPSINTLPTIKTRESPVPISSNSSNILCSTAFKPVASPTKREISPSRNSEPSNYSLLTIKTRESPVTISSAPSPDVLSSPSTPVSTRTPSCMTRSPLSTVSTIPFSPMNNTETIASDAFATAEPTSETPAQLEASTSAESSLACISSIKVSLNQKPACSRINSSTQTSHTADETIAVETTKSDSLNNKPSSSVTCSTTTHSKPTSEAATSSTKDSPVAPITTASTKPSDTKEASQTLPARVQKEVELKVNMTILGRRRTKTWHQGTILEMKATEHGNRYKVKFEGDKGKSMLSGHHLACVDSPLLKDLFVGCRVVACYKEEGQSWLHSAVVTEMPDRKNRMRFMVFFDDGSAAYVSLRDIHLVCKPLKNLYEDIEDKACRTELEEYLQAFPNPIFVVVRVGQESKVERDGKWEDCTISQVDGSLVQVCYTKDKVKEWLYKGSNKMDHIIRIKKRMAEQNPEQSSNKAVSAPNQTTTNTAATTSARIGTQAVASKLSTPQSVSQAVPTDTASKVVAKTAAIVASQPKVLLQRINVSSLSTVTTSKAILHTEPTVTSLSNKGAKRPSSAEIDFYQNVPLPVVEPRLKYIPHRCCPACLDQIRPAQKDQHCGQNPLLIPLLYSFRRITARRRLDGKMSFHVFYRAPCGRSLCEMEDVQGFLFESRCDFLFLDMFCLDPFVLVKRASLPSSMSSRPHLFLPDISEGKEVVSVSCVNEIDSTRPPPLNYSRHRVSAPGVVINTNTDFLVGCDCTDGCRDRSRCSCHQLTIEATSLFTGGPVDVSAGYAHKRLTKYVPTGVYECNPLCRCDPWMCSNRLVQHGLQLRLQVFMTQNKGWGIRCLDDISKGTFICSFTGKIVTDDVASTEASMSGNEYLANLDYIEEAEKLKEGYESEAYCSEEEGDKKTLIRMTTGALKKHDAFRRDSSSGEEMEVANQKKTERNKVTGKRKSATNDSEDESDNSYVIEDDTDDEDYKVSSDEAEMKSKHSNIDCRRSYITRRNAKILNVHEDMLKDVHLSLPLKLAEEQTEVSSSMAKQMRKEGPGFGHKSKRNFAIKSGHRKVKLQEISNEEPQEKKAKCSRRNTRSLYNNEKACFLIDAKQEGNIGRFINHSCSPNLFVQNVFVDTHDLRFPWVTFFTSKRIRAGTELTWDYGYEVGSVEGKVLLCCCGSTECTGRLL